MGLFSKETLKRQGKPPKFWNAYQIEKGGSMKGGAGRMVGYASGGARGAPVKGFAREYPVVMQKGRRLREK